MAKSALGRFQRAGLKRGDPLGQAESMALKEWWISGGALSFDYTLGGGCAIGKILMFFGEKSGGKTTSAARMAGIAQKKCRNCFRPARADEWHVYVTHDDGPDEVVMVQSDGALRTMTRVEAHEFLTSPAMVTGMTPRGALTLAVTTDGVAFYADDEGRVRARVVNLGGTPQAIPPSEEDIADLGEDARWSASGWCSCYAEGLYKPEEEPPKKDPNESPADFKEKLDRWLSSTGAPRKEDGDKPKEYAAKLDRWRENLKLNSYDEFVVSWVDMENSYTVKWFGNLGVDSRRVLLIRPTNAEEAIDICHALALTNEVDLMVIDSIAQLVPQKEITASMEEWQQGLQARLVNKAIRKLSSAMGAQVNRSRPLTQIWINQTREKIGVMFGDPTVKPGGKGQEFAIHAEIKFLPSKVETIDEQYGTKDEVVTIPIKETIRFKNTKNKTGNTRGTEGSYVQLKRDNDRGPAGTIIEDDYIFKLAMHYLVITDKKKGTYTIGDRVWTSQKELLVSLRDEPRYTEIIRATLLEKMLASTGAGVVREAAE